MEARGSLKGRGITQNTRTMSDGQFGNVLHTKPGIYHFRVSFLNIVPKMFFSQLCTFLINVCL